MLRACLVSLVLSFAMSPVSAQTASTPTAAAPPADVVLYVKPAPPGELVDVGGRRLHICVVTTPITGRAAIK